MSRLCPVKSSFLSLEFGGFKESDHSFLGLRIICYFRKTFFLGSFVSVMLSHFDESRMKLQPLQPVYRSRMNKSVELNLKLFVFIGHEVPESETLRAKI